MFDVNHKNNTIGASYLVADILISFLLVTIIKTLHIDIFNIFDSFFPVSILPTIINCVRCLFQRL